jgi:Pheromone A receptor
VRTFDPRYSHHYHHHGRTSVHNQSHMYHIFRFLHLYNSELQIVILILNSPVLVIYTLYKRFSELDKLLAGSNTLDKKQYLRILFIAIISSIGLLALGSFSLVNSCREVFPWPGWTKTHSNFLQIFVLPNSIWRSNHTQQYKVELARWEFVFSAFVIFSVFGVHREALRSYMLAVRYVFRYVSCSWVNQCSVCAIELIYVLQNTCKSQQKIIV